MKHFYELGLAFNYFTLILILLLQGKIKYRLLSLYFSLVINTIINFNVQTYQNQFLQKTKNLIFKKNFKIFN